MEDAEAAAGSYNPKLALLLAMAMFVLVVDTSLMNVSISAVVQDLHTTVSGVQSAIALEALVSAAFILIGSKIGDLFGRKRAYVLGLLGYMTGAIAMMLAQGLTAIIIFWAIIGGLGASLLLPSMQSLIHGNFEGAAQRKVYALVGASAAIAAAIGPLVGGFITTFLSWRVAFGLEAVVILVVLSGIKLVKDVPYTGERTIDPIGAVLSVLGMGGIVLGILAWQEGAESVAILIVLGVAAMFTFAMWLVRRKRAGKATLIDPGLFKSKLFTSGISGQMLQQIALGGLMIALPIYLQMVLEYNAMEAGLSLAPLSLSMFAVAVIAGKKAGSRRPSSIIRGGVRPRDCRCGAAAPDRPPSALRLVAAGAAHDRGCGPRSPRVAAEQLHAVADHRGAGQRGGWRELGRWIVRTLVRPGVRRGDHARHTLVLVHSHGEQQCGAPAGRQGARLDCARGGRRDHDQHAAEEPARRRTPGRAGRDHPDQHRRATHRAASRAHRPAARCTARLCGLDPDDAPP